MQTSVGLSDVATGGRPFITVTVLDTATKAIFQMTAGRQHTTHAQSAAARMDITASSSSAEDDQQNN